MLISFDRMNFEELLLKIVMFLNSLICRSKLFYASLVEGEKEFLKKPCFAQSWGIFYDFCVK